jgi:hypothetical protein
VRGIGGWGGDGMFDDKYGVARTEVNTHDVYFSCVY